MGSLRPLFADFQVHTDGDSDFKQELIRLFIGNLAELKQNLDQVAFDHIGFRDICHKVNSTIYILADKEFIRAVTSVKENGNDQGKRALLNSICLQIIESLEAELMTDNKKQVA
jgi:hypothetical protein